MQVKLLNFIVYKINIKKEYQTNNEDSKGMKYK